MMEIKSDDYQVTYDDTTITITFAGRFRLQGSEYTPIAKLLNDVADEKPELITVDLRELQFLNSSGINALSRFVIRVRKHKSSQMVVKGSNAFPWQKKSLVNLQRFLPGLQLDLE